MMLGTRPMHAGRTLSGTARPRPRAAAPAAAAAARAAPPPRSLEGQFAAAAAALLDECSVGAGPTPLGRGLVAGPRGLRRGDAALALDRANLLCVADAPKRDAGAAAFSRACFEDWQLLYGPLPPPLLELMFDDALDWFQRLVALLLHLRQHATGPWRAYVDMLPQESDMSCLMNFSSPAERAELQSRELEALAEAERAAILGLHARVYSAVSGSLAALRLADAPGDTLWAASLVNSRAFCDYVGGGGGGAVSLLAPCADMANHSRAPAAVYRLDAGAGAFRLEALRDAAPGEEVTISYGGADKDSAALMKAYGFVLPGNVNDRLRFSGGGAAAAALDAALVMRAYGVAGDLLAGSILPVGCGAAGPSVEQGRAVAAALSLQPHTCGGGGGGAAAQRAAAAGLLDECRLELSRGTSAAADEELLARGGGLGARHAAAVAARLERKRLAAAAAAGLEKILDELG